MVFDAKLKQFLCDAKQKKGMVKKGHIRNSKFVKKLGNTNQNRMGAPAACVILLCFAAEDRKSYWNGCIKAAKVNCQQIFSILALIIFL